MSDNTTDGLTEQDMRELKLESQEGQVRMWAVHWGLVMMLVSSVLFITIPEMPSVWFASPRVQSGLTALSAAVSVVGVFLGAWGTNWDIFGINRPNRRS